MRGAEEPATVAEWRRLAAREPEARRRGDYGGLARVFTELTGREQVWQAGLEGWNVEVSQVVLEWQAQARAAGRAEGLVEGRAEALRAKTLRLLQAHFPEGLPADLTAALEAQQDPAVLDRWFDAALAARTLADVRAALGLP
jgi:hypothetical protein